MKKTIQRLEKFEYPQHRLGGNIGAQRLVQGSKSTRNEIEIYVILFILGVITTIASMNLYQKAPYVLLQNHLIQENNTNIHSNKKMTPPLKIVPHVYIIQA